MLDHELNEGGPAREPRLEHQVGAPLAEPVIAGDGARAMKLSDRLFQEGVFAQGIAFPTVARDKARVRTIVTATHTKDELQFALDAFKRVGTELGLI